MSVRLGLFGGFALGLVISLAAPSLVRAGGCPDGGELVMHEIKSGQTLSGIAVKYGVSQRSIERANGNLDPNKIRSGQKIKVCLPPKQKATPSKSNPNEGKSCGGKRVIKVHEVKPGDTLSGIATKYGTDVETVTKRDAKLRKNPNSLRVGQTLEICVDSSKAKNSKTCGYRTPLHMHEVVPGEHLGEIAGRYGVRRKDLIRLNSKLKSNANMLSVGQQIRVCPEIAPRNRTKLQYTVEDGDTLGEIATHYKLTTSELLGFQRGKLKDANDLKVGQTLVVYQESGVIGGYGAYDDDTGVLPSGIQLPGGKHYVVKNSNNAWGTGDTIRLIQSAVSGYRRDWRSSPMIHIGDISKKGGGKFPPHHSHQHGKDVDIGYVLKGEKADEKRFVSANSKNLDVARSWDLIRAFLDTDEIKYIFMDHTIQKMMYEHAKAQGVSKDTLDELFQYPRTKVRGHGMIRHAAGHVNHFHVRFRK